MESKPLSEQQGYLKPYMITVVLIGAVALLHTLAIVPREALNQRYLLLVAVTLIVGSRITVHFFRFDSCISLSDIFIFLSLMMFDGEAAILLSGLEGFVSSLRITKKKLTMAFNSACMAIATFITVLTLRLCFG